MTNGFTYGVKINPQPCRTFIRKILTADQQPAVFSINCSTTTVCRQLRDKYSGATCLFNKLCELSNRAKAAQKALFSDFNSLC